MKLTQNIWLQELMHQQVYQSWGDRSIMFLDPKIVNILQAIRNRFKVPIIMNDWHNGGRLMNRGFRPHYSSVGAKLSQHRFGRAADCHFGDGLTVQEVYADIMANETWYMNQGLTTVEDIRHTTTWLHLDCRWTNEDKIRIVQP